MFNLLWFNRSQRQSQRLIRQLGLRKKGLFLLFLLAIGFWSIALGIGIARAINHPTVTDSLTSISQPQSFLSASSILERYQTAQQLYIETCGGCHIPVSPSVLPTESWKKILENPEQHYGESVNFIRLTQVLLWEYLAAFSRPVSRDEPVPVFVTQARYFKALHPRVELPKPTTIKSCIACHPSAQQYDYQTVSSEWDNAP